MKIIVADRDEVERGMVVRSSYAVISITDPDKPDARIPKTSGCRGMLRLKFDDADPADNFRMPDSIRLCCDDDCDQIARFVAEHRDQVGAFVVHCEAGMSRSPAVAAAIAEAMGDDPAPFFARYIPNVFLFRLLRNRLAMRIGRQADGRVVER